MRKILASAVIWSVCTLGAVAAATAAPPQSPPVALYDGRTLAQDNLSLGNWGGGSVEDSTDLFIAGGHSLKVTTLDFYQGAKINFTTPVALSGSGRMFQVTLQRGPVTLHYDPQTVPGAAAPGSPPNTPGGYGGRGGRRGGGGQGGFGQGGFGGGPGGFGGGPGGYGGGPGGFGGGQGGRGGRGRGGRGGGAAAAPLIPLITKLRLEFTLTDGRKADIVQAIPETADPVAGAGWYSVNVPLASLKFAAGGSAQLQSVTLAGDQFGVLFVGQMQLAALAAAPAAAAKPASADDSGEDNTPQAGGPTFPQQGRQPFPQQGGQAPPERNE